METKQSTLFAKYFQHFFITRFQSKIHKFNLVFPLFSLCHKRSFSAPCLMCVLAFAFFYICKMNCNEVEWGVAAAMAARRASTPTIKSYSTGASQELAYNFAQKVVYSVSCAPLAPGSPEIAGMGTGPRMDWDGGMTGWRDDGGRVVWHCFYWCY